jgi:hypothetical protein
MRHRRRAGLIALNAALLTLLGVVTLSTNATAQNDQRRARGEYTMVAGELLGLNNEAVYIIDAANNEMLGLYWEQSRRTLQPIGYRNLEFDAQQQGGGRR